MKQESSKREENERKQYVLDQMSNRQQPGEKCGGHDRYGTIWCYMETEMGRNKVYILNKENCFYSFSLSLSFSLVLVKVFRKIAINQASYRREINFFESSF